MARAGSSDDGAEAAGRFAVVSLVALTALDPLWPATPPWRMSADATLSAGPPPEPDAPSPIPPTPRAPATAAAFVIVAASAPATAGTAAVSLAAAPGIAAVPVAAAQAAPATGAAVTALAFAPAVPQPASPGQIVGLVLQNPTGGALAARDISFGMGFAAGQVVAGQTLVAQIGGTGEPVQMDVKSRYADGSVQTAVLTLLQPAIAANGSVPVMLALGGPAAAAAPLAISALTDPARYDVTVSLTDIAQNAYATTSGGAPASSTPIPDVTIQVGQLLQQALAGTGGASVAYWLQGPQAVQVEIDSGQIAGTPLHLIFDITLYADGSTHTDVRFNNDLAMAPSLGSEAAALTYDVAITQTVGGTVTTVQQRSGVTQWQYTDWQQTVDSNGAPAVNVQHDVAALAAAGLIQTYDLTTGVNASLIGAAGVAPNMTSAGSGAGIGPQPQWNAVWLMTQDATAAAFALAQADAAGGIPWHFTDAATGSLLNVADDPALWVDPASGQAGSQPLSQPPAIPGWPGVGTANSGWTPAAATAPDLAYVAYLMTGERYYLDELNAEADYAILSVNPAARQGAAGLVTAGSLAAQAWGLREIVEAASVNPTGSAQQTYFSQMATNDIAFLRAEAASMGAGAVSGWFPGGTSGGAVDLAQQEEMATTLGLAAGLGVAGAKALLAWQGNFLAGLFLNGSNGFSPTDGADATLMLYDPAASGAAYTTWPQVAAASQTAGDLGTGTLAASPADQQIARAALAEVITWTGSAAAMQAYGWLVAHATAAGAAQFQADPTLDIVPRLSDGNLLSNSDVFIRADGGTAPVTVQAAADALVYETGAAPATIIGGAGVNILFGGAGTTTLQGGPQADFLFGGSGATTFAGGGGNDFMQAGSGAALFDLTPGMAGTDIIAGFRIGTDHLHVTGAAPGSGALANLIATAAADGGGGTVLQVAPGQTVVLAGLAPSQITSGMFT